MSSDGRTYAWCHAVSLLEWVAAQRKAVRESPDFQESAPLPPILRQATIEASIYAELAKADISVGMVAGEWLQRKWDEEREAEEFHTNIFEKMRERSTPPDGCTCHYSRMACPVHPWPPAAGDTDG